VRDPDGLSRVTHCRAPAGAARAQHHYSRAKPKLCVA